MTELQLFLHSLVFCPLNSSFIIEWHSLTLQNVTEMINYTMGFLSQMLVVLHIKRFALYFAQRSKINICLLLNGTTMLRWDLT